MAEQRDSLRLLSIFHYVFAGITALFACFPVIHFFVGTGIVLASAAGNGGEGPPVIAGIFFMLISGVLILLGWAFAVCVALAGRFISRRKYRIFCLVVGALECVYIPLGTVLGVFTLYFLTKPEVKALFEKSAAESGSG